MSAQNLLFLFIGAAFGAFVFESVWERLFPTKRDPSKLRDRDE